MVNNGGQIKWNMAHHHGCFPFHFCYIMWIYRNIFLTSQWQFIFYHRCSYIIFIGMKFSYVRSYFYWHHIISSCLTTHDVTGDNTCQLVNMSKSKRNDLSLKQKYNVVQVVAKNPEFGIRKLTLVFKCGKTKLPKY